MTAGPRFDLRRSRSPSFAWRGLRELLFASPLYQMTLAGRAPDAVRGTPPDPWPGDKEAAAALLDGEFLFLGRRIALGAAPWSAIEASTEAAQCMHRFGWLRDLRAVATNAARQRARDLVSGWIEANGRWNPRAWRADVIGERSVNLLTSFTFLVHGANEDFAARVLGTLARQFRHLARAAASAPGDARVLRAGQGADLRRRLPSGTGGLSGGGARASRARGGTARSFPTAATPSAIPLSNSTCCAT